jgi:hypothetical protein
MMFFSVDIETLNEKIINFLSRKPIYSNYYGIDLKNVQYFEDSETLLLLKPFETFNRVYFLSMDAPQLIKYLKALGPLEIINIPAKKNINESISRILQCSGYHLVGIYERWFNNITPSNGEFTGTFVTDKEIKEVYDIVHSAFNPFMDHLPSLRELNEMAINQQILVNKNEKNNVTGVFIFTLEKTKCYFNCWVDKEGGGNGLFLLFNAFNYMKDKNIEKSYLWLNSENTTVKQIYQMFRYKPDGLKDYTFTKK